MTNTTPTTQEFETRLSTFLAVWQKSINEDYAKNFPNLTPPTLVTQKGRRFVKIIRQDSSGSRSVAGFVSMDNGTHMGAPVKFGDILMAASWSAPAKHSRGSIFDPGAGINAVTTFGVRYL